MDSEEPKLCINCTHYAVNEVTLDAMCTSLKRSRSYVDGSYQKTWCKTNRIVSDSSSCGPNGLWYEQRQTPLDTSGVV